MAEEMEQSKQPAPLAIENGTDSSDAYKQINVNEPVRLDALGPMVVNEAKLSEVYCQNGTLSRISNWASMTGPEQTNVLRVIGKRNKIRLEKLREQEKKLDVPVKFS
ncbi:hypothetical protein HDU85_006944 [Gaertneriomyces sp. JEL0708]|nr:hypothetical protein HDU85_006944 [Gaertneriomyces sp. JEL0708]